MTRLAIPGSSIAISRLTFGCARLAAGAEFRTSARLIERALRQGVTHFDTAPMYGSEDVLGAVIGNSPDVTIATKVGIPRAADTEARHSHLRSFYRNAIRPALGHFPGLKARLVSAMTRPQAASQVIVKRELQKDAVLRELDESMRRLKRTCIDVYLIHEPEQFELSDDLLETFTALRRSGAIKSFGLGHGGLPPSDPCWFGSVVQCRYAEQIVPLRAGPHIHLFHGVLRHGLQTTENAGTRRDARQRVADVLRQHEQAAVVFSASSERQIDAICCALQD